MFSFHSVLAICYVLLLAAISAEAFVVRTIPMQTIMTGLNLKSTGMLST